MDENYRILIAEDVPADADLAEREIRKVLPTAIFTRVETKNDFIRALEHFDPHLIISDYQMPTFDGMTALKIALETAPLIPFIIYTGSMNEDTAVECMKAGATDYVIKEDIKRLGPAIKRALEIKAIKLENQQAQDALIESENRFRRLAENATDLIYRYEFEPIKRFAYVSPSATAITGYTPEEHYNDPDLGSKTIHPDDRHLLEEMKISTENLKKTRTFRRIKKSGDIIWIEQINVPVFSDNGELFAIEGIARDITKRKLAEDAIRQSEERFRTLLNRVYNISVQGYDKYGTIHYWNKASEHIYGYAAEETIGKNLVDLIIPQHMRDLVRGAILEMAQTGIGHDAEEITLQKKDGSPVTVFSNHVVINIPGQETELYCIDVDLSERDIALEEVKQNEARLRSLVNILQSSSINIEDYLDQSLEEAIKLTGSKIGYIYTYDENKQQFRINSWSKNVMDNCAIVDPQSCYELDTTGIWGEAVRQRKPIILNDFIVENPLKKGFPEGHVPIKNFLTIPIIIDDKIGAVLGVANKDSDYQESDVLQLTLLMNSTWKVIEKKKNEHEIQILSTATEQSPVSVIITDTNGAIQFVNEKFISSTRYTGEELQGRILRVFRPDFKSQEEYENIRSKWKLGEPYKGELKNIKDNGDMYWEWVNISPIRDKNGIITNFVILSEDITSRKKMEVDLIAAKEKAEENDRLKTAFLNNLSHEIRTPLNAVVGYSQLLNTEDADSDKIKKYSEIILQGSNQLLSIMENIITMAVIETGQLKINKTKCNLNRILNSVYNQLKYKADNKNIKFQSSALFSLYESEVTIDETKVIQILTNLVENAIKYTDSGFVKFGCSVSASDVLFFVEDTGRGIPENMKDIVFERFRQGADQPGNIQEGLGLGLSISKSYVQLMGGELRLESKENHGSKFTFSIPYKAAMSGSASKKQSSSALNLLIHKTILVVDDVEINYYLVSELLHGQNLSVVYASSGADAIEQVTNNPDIDLVLMDIKMPGMDGYTATMEIKKRRPDLPVIAQTAYALAGDRQKSIENGCDDYISKPLSQESLIGILKRFLEK